MITNQITKAELVRFLAKNLAWLSRKFGQLYVQRSRTRCLLYLTRNIRPKDETEKTMLYPYGDGYKPVSLVEYSTKCRRQGSFLINEDNPIPVQQWLNPETR